MTIDFTPNMRDSEQACWRKIGIWGNENTRCEKLKFVKHCRNCEVFEQTVKVETAAYQERLTPSGAVEREPLIGDKSLMPFRLGNYCLAVPSHAVLTISDQVGIHSIPFNIHPIVKGLVAINHEVYTFIHLERLLGIDNRTSSLREIKRDSLFIRTLVVNFSGRVVVFYVDEVYQIYRYFEKNMTSLGDEISDIKFVRGVFENHDGWCDDCHLLDMKLTSDHLMISKNA